MALKCAPIVFASSEFPFFKKNALGRDVEANEMYMKQQAVVSNCLQPHELQPARFLCPWNFPGKNTRVGCHFPLQGIFPIQGWNPCLLNIEQADSLPTEPPGKPRSKYEFLLFLYFLYSVSKIVCFHSLNSSDSVPRDHSPPQHTHTHTQTHGGRACDCTHVFVYTNGLQFEVTFSFLGRLGQREDMLVYEERAAFLDSIVKI